MSGLKLCVLSEGFHAKKYWIEERAYSSSAYRPIGSVYRVIVSHISNGFVSICLYLLSIMPELSVLYKYKSKFCRFGHFYELGKKLNLIRRKSAEFTKENQS